MAAQGVLVSTMKYVRIKANNSRIVATIDGY